MPTSPMSIEIKGLNDLARLIAPLSGTDIGDILEQVTNPVREALREWFESEGDGSWEPLSPTYAAWKSQHFPGKGINRATDVLFKSMTGDGDGSILSVSGNKLTLGSRIPYADDVHNQRPIVPEDLKDIIEAATDSVRKTVRAKIRGR